MSTLQVALENAALKQAHDRVPTEVRRAVRAEIWAASEAGDLVANIDPASHGGNVVTWLRAEGLSVEHKKVDPQKLNFPLRVRWGSAAVHYEQEKVSRHAVDKMQARLGRMASPWQRTGSGVAFHRPNVIGGATLAMIMPDRHDNYRWRWVIDSGAYGPSAWTTRSGPLGAPPTNLPAGSKDTALEASEAADEALRRLGWTTVGQRRHEPIHVSINDDRISFPDPIILTEYELMRLVGGGVGWHMDIQVPHGRITRTITAANDWSIGLQDGAIIRIWDPEAAEEA